MIDTIIVSGGNIHSDFALDFLKKNEACLIAADKGLEFFLEHQLLPDAVIGDFDSLSEDGKKFLEIQEEKNMDSEIPDFSRISRIGKTDGGIFNREKATLCGDMNPQLPHVRVFLHIRKV